jgi:hypothetical protein
MHFHCSGRYHGAGLQAEATAKRTNAAGEALLAHETLDEDDVYAAAGVSHPDAPPAEIYTVAARSTPQSALPGAPTQIAP